MPAPERLPDGRLRFPADVLNWILCPNCWFKRAVGPKEKDPGCPMCPKED